MGSTKARTSLPVACTLSAPEKRERETSLIAKFKSGVVATLEIENGYAFQFSGASIWIEIAAEFMVAERECCPFLLFELAADPDQGPVTVRITGPGDTKEFLQTLLL